MANKTRCEWSKNGKCTGYENTGGACGFVYPNEDACAIILGSGPKAEGRKPVEVRLWRNSQQENLVIYTNEKLIKNDLEIYKPGWELIGYNEIN